MIFGVHNYYNNNSETIGDFRSPHINCLISEVPVRVTDQGITIFNLDKRLELDKKIVIAYGLHNQLKQDLGKGLSFASCGVSVCLAEHEMAPYYAEMKKIEPNIITIFATAKNYEGAWIGLPSNLGVEHIVNCSADAAAQVLDILKPTDADKAEPPEGWRKFERSLERVYLNCARSDLKIA